MTYPTNKRGGWIVPDRSIIASGTTIPSHSVFGNGCEIGNWCDIGDRCKIGDECKIDGIACAWFMTAANIDGTGRQILIVSDGTNTIVRAGCFRGSVDAFVAKAAAEGKSAYAAVIPAMVSARMDAYRGVFTGGN